MWELIRANQRKSQILFFVMGVCLILLGFLAGSAYFGDEGGLLGIIIAVLIWLVLSMISYFAGSSIVLAVSNAKEVTPDVHPQLFNVVEEMKLAAALPKMPKVYIINAEAPNAFATGNSPENCAVAVTAGLLAKLNRDELQGVVAHEVSHIMNRDIRFITFAGVMIGSIVLISEIFLRGFFFTGGSSKRYSNKSSGGGQSQIFILIFAIIFAILAPILARLLYFAISRKREYLADASAVRLTRYPEGLASALEKIASSNEDLPVANKVTAPMYIINPLKKKGMQIADLTSTHPPISERIRILRSMSSGINYTNYQEAYSKVKGTNSRIIPESGIKESFQPPARAGAASVGTENARTKQRTLGDLMMAVNNYSFINCTCGLKMKVPPGFNRTEVLCPKCGTMNKIISKS
ncbi:MAG: M48 family metallopeptidase [bacterium]